MTDDTDPDRRTVLQSLTVAAAASVGSVPTAVAADEPTDDSTQDPIPFDMKLTNRAPTAYDPTVRIHSVEQTADGGFETTGTVAYERSFSLESAQTSGCTTASVTESSLGLDGNRRYEVQLTTPAHDEVETTTFGVPPGGVPGYVALMLDVSPSGTLRATVAKD